MNITIAIKCPHCQSPNITRNGKEIKEKHRTESPHYRCKDCGRQFISNHEMTYRGCLPWIVDMVKIMFVRGMGIRDISAVLHISVLHISITKVLKVLIGSLQNKTEGFSR